MRSRKALEIAQGGLRAKFAPQRRGRGRPPLEIDPVAVSLLAREGHSTRVIGEYLLCDPGTIRRRFGHLLHAAQDYRIRWSWVVQDATLEGLQREGWLSSPPAPQASSFIHRTYGRRTREQRHPGRPKLAINKDWVLELLLAGYAPKGIAREVGCSVRTLGRRFPDLLAGQVDRGTLERLIFRLVIEEGNSAALLLLARRLAGKTAGEPSETKKRKSRSASEVSYEPMAQK